MGKKVMICGVDCKQGDAYCNGYCIGKTDAPPPATPAQKLEAAKALAYEALTAAERAWFEYAGLLPVGDMRTHAFTVFERILRVHRF